MSGFFVHTHKKDMVPEAVMSKYIILRITLMQTFKMGSCGIGPAERVKGGGTVTNLPLLRCRLPLHNGHHTIRKQTKI